MPRQVWLGEYGERYGTPEFEVEVEDGKLKSIKVLRGAPCGATWRALEKLVGMDVSEVATRYGLDVQFNCSADPAGWDPLWGKSPVHLAADVHFKALQRALKAVQDKE